MQSWMDGKIKVFLFSWDDNDEETLDEIWHYKLLKKFISDVYKALHIW